MDVLDGGIRTKSPAIDLALERYERALETREPRDSLLDSFIGLEALLLGGIREEKAFQLSVRAAHLIGDSPAQRPAVAALLKKGYHVRSALVHGGVPEPEIKVDGAKLALVTVAGQVRDILRECIKRVLLRKEFQDSAFLNKSLGERILGLADPRKVYE